MGKEENVGGREMYVAGILLSNSVTSNSKESRTEDYFAFIITVMSFLSNGIEGVVAMVKFRK